jgi:xanthine dehydrogenase YagR molybdenum-binding subunit
VSAEPRQADRESEGHELRFGGPQASRKPPANGSVEIASATADIGPGTYTMMTQLAADMLGVPHDHVTAKLGDSALPDAPVEGGSFTTSSVGSAIHAACRAVQEELLRLAQRAGGSPLAGAKLDE